MNKNFDTIVIYDELDECGNGFVVEKITDKRVNETVIRISYFEDCHWVNDVRIDAVEF